MTTLTPPVQALTKTQRPFLADGGLETWLFFQQGFEAPEFAAITLMRDAEARAALRRYFDGFLDLAQKAGTGFVLDTNTWRGAVGWAPKLGLSETELLALSGLAVDFAKETRRAWSGKVAPIVLNGVVGPLGDGYSAVDAPSPEQAEALHRPQIEVLVAGGVDMISAITMTSSAEAIGVARAAGGASKPVALSFTVETDGRLPSGETLREAIETTDAQTARAPLYYMVNCAHTEHFRGALKRGEPWLERIGGVRANASRLSHAELDQAETLDDGDPLEFGAEHAMLARLLPNLKVVGGCCGSDHRHIGCVSHHLHASRAA